MTGSGTQADPYIISAWSELITSRNATDYYEWHGGNLDFNTIQPSGFSSAITIYGIGDFKGATFKNFRSIASNAHGINFNGRYLYNLNFLNAYFSGNDIGIAFGLSNNSSSVNNCSFSGIVTPRTGFSSSHVSMLDSLAGGSGRVTLNQCAVNFEAYNNSGNMYIVGDKVSLIDCRVNLDIVHNGLAMTAYGYGDGYETYRGFQNCKFTGRVLNTEGETIVISRNGYGEDTGNQPPIKNNAFLFSEGSYKLHSSGGVSVCNSDTMTLDAGSTNVVACTSAQLQNPAYLRSVGFPIGG